MKHKKTMIVGIIVLAVVLIISALSNSTYALFSNDAYGANTNAYTTGMLLIEANSKSESISLANALPITDEEGLKTNPYVFTIKNIGNLDYLFDVKLLSTGDSSTSFLPQYIKLQIDDGDVTTLASLTNGEIKSDVTLHAGDSIDVSVRVWLSIETPNSEIGKSFNSKIVTDGQAVYTSSNNEFSINAVQYIRSLYNGAEKTVVTNYGIEYNQAQSVSLMNDRLGGTTNDYNGGNIRYYGASPNNYIYFNCKDYSNQNDETCEKWRIIGVFDGKIKIIKEESRGSMAWDTNGTSDWSVSTLNTYFNNDYYNTLGVSTQKLISDSTWYLGGWNTSAVRIDEMYKYERGTTVYTGRPTQSTGKIALMYPSDYGYATDFSSCNTTLHTYNSVAVCYQSDWLYTGIEEWLLNPYSDRGASAFEISAAGAVTGNRGSYGGVDYSVAVRPTLYLNADVEFNSKGDGSSGTPYQIYIEPKTAASYITDLYNNAEKTVITHNGIEYNQAQSFNLMNDRLGGTTEDYDAGNIRYYGANPNNYVYFNCSDYDNPSSTTCEKWRIIGVFGDNVKIMRSESIGTFSWDTSFVYDNDGYGFNDWSQADLMKLLNPGYEYSNVANNSLYYNSNSGSAYKGSNNYSEPVNFESNGLKDGYTKNIIADVTWNIGGSSNLNYSSSMDVYVNEMYASERSSEAYSGNAIQWNGKVALMYVSDYGYAADLASAAESLKYIGSGLNWIWQTSSKNEWTLSHVNSSYYGSNYNTFFIDENSIITMGGGGDYVFESRDVRPTLYLNSAVQIYGGEGSEDYPYVIK